MYAFLPIGLRPSKYNIISSWIAVIVLLTSAGGCEITTGFIYEEKISATQSVKATIEVKKIEITKKGIRL